MVATEEECRRGGDSSITTTTFTSLLRASQQQPSNSGGRKTEHLPARRILVAIAYRMQIRPLSVSTPHNYDDGDHNHHHCRRRRPFRNTLSWRSDLPTYSAQYKIHRLVSLLLSLLSSFLFATAPTVLIHLCSELVSLLLAKRNGRRGGVGTSSELNSHSIILRFL